MRTSLARRETTDLEVEAELIVEGAARPRRGRDMSNHRQSEPRDLVDHPENHRDGADPTASQG
jgi:hypothetical protein